MMMADLVMILKTTKMYTKRMNLVVCELSQLKKLKASTRLYYFFIFLLLD